jgi:hypothetical protein
LERNTLVSATTTLDAAAVRRGEGWFYVAMGIVALILTVIGFGPAVVDTSSRKAPLTLAVALHGVVFSAWLILFLAQTLLVKSRIEAHRRLGYAGAVLAVLMIATGYFTSIAMARRGYDLSGDLNAASDPLGVLVFQLGDLVSFGILVAVAVWYRRRPEIHKRLMLLATVGALMPASLVHIIGHSTYLRDIKAPIILIPLVILLFSAAVHDRLTRGCIHPVSIWVPVVLLIWANVRAAIIGPSEAWHQFAAWLIS